MANTLDTQQQQYTAIKVIGNVGNGHEAQNVYDKDGLAPTIKENHGKTAKTMTNMRIRRLTPTECARLQGFPDNWHEGVSDSQAYRCYGNAVSVPIVAMIARRLKE